MDNFWRDCKLAWRRIRSAPGVAIFAVVTLALGIGVATGAYSVVYTGLWRPLGLGDESRVVLISRSNMMRPGPTQVTSEEFSHLAREQRSLSSVAAWGGTSTVLASKGTAELVDVEFVTGDYFKTLGVDADLGRTIQPEDDRDNAPSVAVLSNSTWRDQFDSDTAIVGRRVKIADRDVQVIGVAPSGFRGVNPGQFVTKAAWMPLARARDILSSGLRQRIFESGVPAPWLFAAGRITPGQTRDQAKADVTRVGELLDTAAPLKPFMNSQRVAVQPSRNWTTGFPDDTWSPDANELGRIIVVLPGLVLLIACTNLANLVLSRGTSRRHDFAVRRALGASRWRLIREQLVEQAAIAVVGGALGLVVARTLVSYCAGIARVTMAPFTRGARMDWALDAGVLQATGVAVALSLLVFGLIPALHLTRDSLRTVLAQDGTSTPRWRGRGNLIALQVGVSVGLFLISVVFIRIMLTELPRPDVATLPPGLDRVAVALVPFNVQHRDEARARETIGRILADPQFVAASESVAVTSNVNFPFLRVGGSLRNITVASQAHPFVGPDSRGHFVTTAAASPSFFTAFGTPVKFGRPFNDRSATGALPEVVINEGLALDLFGVADATGRDIHLREQTFTPLGDSATTMSHATVVGVVAGGALLKGRTPAHESAIYLPFTDYYESNLFLVARARAGTADPVEALSETIKRVDPELAVSFKARADVLAIGPLAFAPYIAVLLTLLAVLALVLAMAGLYGVLSHVVAKRTREMGIRIALGAEPARIKRLVVRDGFRPIVEGLVIGIATAVIVRMLMKMNLSLNIGAMDPLAFGGAIVLLIVAGSAACYLPARRASRVDPNTALRTL